MTPEEKLLRETILQMKLGGLDRAYFHGTFGVDVAARFAEPLGRLGEAGYLTVTDDRVALSRAGLLRVDELLHEFFLPRHRTDRYT
jgi:oxygen-independent coproporphyrinogen-3 oxidase